MTLLFVDSFDHYDVPRLPLKYTNVFESTTPVIGPGYGRLGSSGIEMLGSGTNTPSYIERVLPNSGSLIMGFAFNQSQTTWPAARLAGFFDTGTEQVSVHCNSLGRFEVWRGTTLLGTSAGSYYTNVWYYLELRVTFATGATGSIDLHLDGSSIVSASGIVTSQTANAYANTFRLLGNQGSLQNFDDLYVCDINGPVNNTFLGDVRVQALLPSGAGSNTTWAVFPNTDANWQAVKEVPPDDDTSYVSSLTPGQVDTYAFTDLASTSGSVLGVQFVLDIRKDDAGTRTIAPAVREGVTNHVGSNMDVPSSYSFQLQIMETDPATAAAWTVAAVNADEFGVEMIA